IPPTFRSCIGGFDDPDLIRRGYNFFQGRINQVRISRTARYQNPFTPQTRFEPDKDTPALYQFDEGGADALPDSSGNGHHGKIDGAKWVPGIAGGPTVVQRAMDNSALSIDGPGEYASFPNPYSDYRQPLTLEAWVRPAQLSTNAYFFAAPSSLTLKIQKINDPNKPEYVWQFVGYAPDGKLYGTTSRVAPAVGEWAHLAGVWEGSNLYLYVNGELHYKLAVPDGLRGPKAGEPFFTGPPPPQAQGFRGEIDEIRLSKIARYTANFTPERRFKGDANTLALYHFDEGAGDVLTDSSGNNHDGKIVGAQWVRVPASGDLPPLAIAPFNSEQAKTHQYAWARHINVPVEYENSVGMKFRLIPPGVFSMGYTQAQLDSVSKELSESPWAQNQLRVAFTPPREVRIREPYYLGTHE